MNCLKKHVSVVSLLGLMTPLAFSAEPHPCAGKLDAASLSRLTKDELIDGVCSSLWLAKGAQDEGRLIEKAMPAKVKSEEDKRKVADLLSQGMFRVAIRDMCLEKADAYSGAYRARFGNEPRCTFAPEKK